MKRELLTWLHYFLIMLIAATVAGFFYEKSMQVPTDANVGSGGGDIAMNFHGLIQSLWRDYYRWWLGVFTGLSAVRFLFLFLNSMRAKSTLT